MATTTAKSIAACRARVGSAVLAMAGTAIVAGCSSTPEERALPEPPGCYYFVQDADARALRLPWGVRLSASPLEGWPRIQTRGDAREAATLTAEGDRDHPFGYWLAAPADSVELGHPGGGGLVLRLAREGTGFSGTATSVGDAGLDARPVRPVRLTWARCPEAGPFRGTGLLRDGPLP